MKTYADHLFGLMFFLLLTTLSWGQTKVPMARVNGGSFIPLYGSDSSTVIIGDFLMDVYPVTNEEYLEFIKNNPTWRRSRVKGIFADETYLTHWQGDLNYEPLKPESPVTGISWFAAKAYCACQGKRLPTVDEWEYAAMANESIPDARVDSSYNQFILSWYETPKTFNNSVGETFKNYYGIYDLHGLVWEWTQDFNAVILSGESRNTDRNLFCSAAAVGATDLMNYAAFMRYAFRSSLKANYSIRNLGFRCVKSLNKEDI